MKSTLLCLLLIYVWSTKVFCQDLYDINTINTIEITFKESNWDQLLNTYYSNDNNEKLMGSIIINGVELDRIGVKFKGNSTYRANSAKNPLHIYLNYLINQDYNGYKSIKLSNGLKDPSFVREVLSYEIARKYMDAPLSNYTKIYINGSYYGLFSSSEPINKGYIKRHLNADADNTRIKCNPENTFAGNGPSLEYLGANESSYTTFYELKSDDGWQDLIDLTYAIENTPEDIENILDIDKTIWMLAFDNILVNLDSYIGPFRQNYYLIKDNNGLFTPVIWDLNESFGSFTAIENNMRGRGPGPGPDSGRGAGPLPGSVSGRDSDPRTGTGTGISRSTVPGSDSGRSPSRGNDTGRRPGGPPPGSNPESATNLSELDPFLREGDDSFPLLKLIFDNDRYKKMYIAHCKTILEENFENGWYKTEAENLQSLIAKDLKDDPNAFYSNSQFFGNIDATQENAIGITELMESRIKYLNKQAAFNYIQPTISNISTPDVITPNSTINITTEVYDAKYVELGYRHSNEVPFTKIQMYDDGNHNDGLAGDHVYGISFSVDKSNTHYYIYAENKKAGVFSPKRAQFEYYKISTISESEE
jgi:spore coat protein CotH